MRAEASKTTIRGLSHLVTGPSLTSNSVVIAGGLRSCCSASGLNQNSQQQESFCPSAASVDGLELFESTIQEGRNKLASNAGRSGLMWLLDLMVCLQRMDDHTLLDRQRAGGLSWCWCLDIRLLQKIFEIQFLLRTSTWHRHSLLYRTLRKSLNDILIPKIVVQSKQISHHFKWLTSYPHNVSYFRQEYQSMSAWSGCVLRSRW